MEMFGAPASAHSRYDEAIINCINLNRVLFNRQTHEVCHKCRGKGGYDIACGPYDYDLHECSLCRGAGYVEHKIYKKMYKDFKAKEKAKAEEKERIETELKRIKSKITKEELEFLYKYSRCSYS